ncbi:phytochelatin synthase family protein [Gloeothece verrucosa]|uniref:glutathione gamma-glutamylcysteinyltransferase n=1 Tax=Gloeothece verrucosa (strain PCC 7822) TaxID=497965 RepID=E0UG72_GLOV7|nr:phytochelatin synthase family protein [Gloeothece verrucosa]ADN15573.1 Glutathione gamma-glutamylcysteinyltransferase [Gloeothece verrucosa PCC 7822]
MRLHRRSKLIFCTLPGIIVALGLTVEKLLGQTLPLAPNLINFNSTEGEKLLLQSKARQDYFPLSIHFLTQENPAWCGVASIVMVLNALGISAPEDPVHKPYHAFTQTNLFDNPKTSQIITAEQVSRQGMTLQQLGQLLESYSLKVKVYYGSEVSLEQFRQLVMKNLEQPNNYVIVNYLRSTLHQERGGHISPIAAYNKETDRFLILDVARYKYPPVWVSASELWQAIRTLDQASNKSRGFVLVNSP